MRNAAALIVLLASLASSGRAVVQGPVVIPAEGQVVPIPGTDCTVSVAAWENSTWVDPASPEGTRRPKPGQAKTRTDTDATLDVRDIVRWLTQLFEASPDMRNKTKGACEALGVKQIAIRLVRDDPQATSPGAWKIGTNLILLDMAKAETMGKHIETTSEGPQNPSLQDSARLRLQSLLGPILIPHEMDHAMRARGTLDRDRMEALAVEDENQVAAELAAFLGRDSAFRSYKRESYGQGGYIPITVDNVRLRVNVAKAARASVQKAGGDPQFSELDDHDHAAVDGRNSLDLGLEASKVWATSGTARFVGYAEEAELRALIEGDYGYIHRPPARPESTHQRMGFSMLELAQGGMVVADAAPAPEPALAESRAAFGVLARLSPPWSRWATSRPTWDQGGGGTTGLSRVLFTSLGESSGPAFTLTVVGGNLGRLSSFPGLVLEPVAGVTAAEAERAIRAMPGPRTTVTVNAYCLDQPKAVPARGMVYRLAPLAEQKRMSAFGQIIAASERLRAAGRFVPDVDPADYLHAIRQWATWAEIQGIRTEAAFANALVSDARKRVSEAGERWTRAIEDGVRAVAPNRWQDVSQVLAIARR